LNPAIESLKVKLFADGADIAGMVEMAGKPYISGLTTNPTLMRKAGITDYSKFAKDVLREITTKQISFEVFSDDLEDMKIQGEKIASWGKNVNVKIPITTTRGISTATVIQYLSKKGVSVNATALMTQNQVKEVSQHLDPDVPSFVSVFAGRIADTGRDPIPIMAECVAIMRNSPKASLIWASPRELLNIFQADQVGCHVITATNDLLKKLEIVGRDLSQYSLETVQMFYDDAKKAGFNL